MVTVFLLIKLKKMESHVKLESSISFLLDLVLIVQQVALHALAIISVMLVRLDMSLEMCIVYLTMNTRSIFKHQLLNTIAKT